MPELRYLPSLAPPPAKDPPLRQNRSHRECLRKEPMRNSGSANTGRESQPSGTSGETYGNRNPLRPDSQAFFLRQIARLAQTGLLSKPGAQVAIPPFGSCFDRRV